MFLHQSKIAVVMQQGVAVLDAVGTDDDVRGLADRDTERTELTVIPCHTWSQVGIEQRDDFEGLQTAFDTGSMPIVARALQHLE